MALALAPEGASDVRVRPLEVEIGLGPARGATLVDWDRRFGGPDNTAILMAYGQERFEGLVRRALGLHEVAAAG